MRDLPVNLYKDDFDVDIETSLPYFGSRYKIVDQGEYVIVSKQIAFKKDGKTLFVETQIQDGAPPPEQAKMMASNFGGVLTESGKHMYGFKGDGSRGVIGYCPEAKQIYLVYTTSYDPINISCKKISNEQANPLSMNRQ